METLRLKLDAKDAIEAIKAAIEPGAMLLPADVVRKVCEWTGATEDELITLGAIRGSDEA